MFSLKQLRLYTPYLGANASVPITSFGYPGKAIARKQTLSAGGPNYVFYADPYEDCFLTPEGKLLPISDAIITSKPGAPYLCQHFRGDVSFSCISANRVQVNIKSVDGMGWLVSIYDIDDLLIDGEAFDLDE